MPTLSSVTSPIKNYFRDFSVAVAYAYELFFVLDVRTRWYVIIEAGVSLSYVVVDLLSIISIVPFLGMLANAEAFAEKAWMVKISDFLGSPDTRVFTVYLGLISLATLMLRHVIFYALSVLSLRVSVSMASTFFTALLRCYLDASYYFHLQNHSGTLIDNLFKKCVVAGKHMFQGLFGMLRNLVFSILGITVLLVQDPIMATVGVTGAVLVIVVFAIRNNAKVMRLSARVEAERTSMQRRVQDVFSAVEDIKMNACEAEYGDSISASFRHVKLLDVRVARLFLLFRPILETVLYSSIVGVIAYHALQGSALSNITSLALFGLIFYRMLPYMHSLYQNYILTKRGALVYKLVRDDMLRAFKHTQKTRRVRPLKNWRDVECKNLSYRYPGTPSDTIRSINLRIERGSSIGFCGVSGSGKSTITKLLLGMLEGDKGSISIDSAPLRGDLTYRWQDSVAYVPQTIAMMDASIIENVTLSLKNPHANRARVERAIELARLEDYVSGLQHGLDTVVGQSAATMSVGQRQRLAIARALYSERDVLLLDEGTSALDSKTERDVMDNVRNHLQNCTLILVAHRINTIRECDVIHVVREGAIIDSGTYDALYGRSKHFRDLVGGT